MGRYLFFCPFAFVYGGDMYFRSQITAICEKQSKFVIDLGVNVRRETTLLYLRILMFSLFNHKYILSCPHY
jgi:hypothetical protein